MPQRHWNTHELRPRLTLSDLEPMLAEAEGELKAASRMNDEQSRPVREARATRDSLKRRVDALKADYEKRQQQNEDAKTLDPAALAEKYVPRRGW